MSNSEPLARYQSKRRFSQTPEPEGVVHKAAGPLRFVVQKHQASRLHYDFRIEVAGTLKSWAVPKGPSFQSHEKRLAVMVEDHPLDYLLFEGTIPKGNYGAGTVMVWDEGTYHLPAITNREQCEHDVVEGLKDGNLHLVLHGQKLRGEYGLVKMKRGDENSWLFFLKSPNLDPPPGESRSVITGRTMDEITMGAKPVETTPSDLVDVPSGAMPRNVKPMLAGTAEKPFDRPGWMFELKWDGYRAIAEIEKRRVRLYSRRDLSFDRQYPAIVDSLQHVGHDVVLDGEVVVLDSQGKPTFGLLQSYQRDRIGTLVYEVFDLIYLDGHDLKKLPLERRKALLARVIPELPNIRLSEHILEHGTAFFEAVSARSLEGMIAKDSKSTYAPGVRSQSWLKIKTQSRQEAVIGGFTEPKGSRAGLGALLLGVFDGADLKYIGHTGTGFSDKALVELRSRLDKLIQPGCPFQKRPKPNARAHWVRPELVCEVSFLEWTHDGIMRNPVFLDVREGKNPESVTPEASDVLQPRQEAKPAKPAFTPTASTPSKLKTQEVIGGHVLALSNLKKVYWPDEGYTKGDLVAYYRAVAEFMVPCLKDRPQSLNRHPNGIDGKSFFQKDVRKQPPPEWVQTVEIADDSGDSSLTLLCQDEATLVYLANLGCIEINPWNARIQNLDIADYVLLDLDPEDISFDQVCFVAQAIHELLTAAGAACFCKTSGKRGLHVYLPFGAPHTHEQAKQFANLVAQIIHRKLPHTTSLIRDPARRQKRVYLDFLQNGKGKTLAAAYSVRPYPGATVSTPLSWDEVTKKLDPAQFTIKTMPRRLETKGDLWNPVLGPGFDLPMCLERMAELL